MMRTTTTLVKTSPGRYRCLLMVSIILLATFANRVSASDTSYNRQNQQALTPLQLEIEKQKQRLAAAEVEERRDAVMRLGALHRTEASRAVVPALADPSPIIRVTAAIAILSLPAEEGVMVLTPLLSDKDPFVRQEVAYALGGFHNRLATPA